MKISSVALFTRSFSVSVLMGSFAYFIGGDSYEKVVNLAVIFSTFILLAFVFISSKLKYPKYSASYLLLIVFILYTMAISLLLNSVVEWLPTLLRYLIYVMVFSLAYIYAGNGVLDNSFVEKVMLSCLLIGAFSGLVELVTGSVRFVNGAYRVAGNFNHHHLGYALYMFVPLHFLAHRLMQNFSAKIAAVWVFGFILFLLSHSRSLLVLLVISIAFSIFYWQKSYSLKTLIVICVGVLGVGLYNFVLYTDYLPRLKEMLVVDEVDPSTLYRLFVIDESLSAMTILDYIFGIGLGGFNQFFYFATGISGTAAHNDYLLALVEGGVGGFLMYVLFQLGVLRMFLKLKVEETQNSHMIKSAFSLFLFLEVAGFLLNAHYFYQSEMLVCLLLGVAIGQLRLKEEK